MKTFLLVSPTVTTAAYPSWRIDSTAIARSWKGAYDILHNHPQFDPSVSLVVSADLYQVLYHRMKKGMLEYVNNMNKS